MNSKQGKVLHVIPSVSEVHGGPSRAINVIERALFHSGWVVDTATTDDDGQGKRLDFVLGRRLNAEYAARWYFHKDTEFYKVSKSFIRWVLREVRRYDVVHIHALFSFTSVVAAWAARRAGVPYVIRPLGVLKRYGITQRRPWFKQLSLRFIEGPLLRNSAVVHFTSEAERDEALELGIPIRSVIIPLGIEPVLVGDAKRFLDAVPDVELQVRLLFLGRIDPVKNLEGLIHALRCLRESGTFPALLIGGSGDGVYVESLKALARDEGVDQQIHWLGHVSGDMKADLLAAADLFVLPSFSENFGIAVVEALAGGLPCVVARGVALAQVVERNGAGLAVNSDGASIAAAIHRYLESAELRAEAGKAARQLAEREYSVDKMGERLVSLYETVRRKK